MGRARFGASSSLSREDTDVRSLALSLNQKRAAMTGCLEALEALRQAIPE